MARGKSALLLSAVPFQEDPFAAANLIEPQLEEFGLHTRAAGQEDGIHWIFRSTEAVGQPLTLAAVLDTAEVILILNHESAEKSSALKSILRAHPRRDNSVRRQSLTIIYLAAPLILPSVNASVLPGNGMSLSDSPDREAVLRDITEGIRFLIGERPQHGPVSVFYSYAHTDEDLRAKLERALASLGAEAVSFANGTTA